MSEKYLIFGATGSIGSSLAEQLVNTGNSVHLVGRNESETKSISEKLGCAFTIADVLQDGFVDKVKNDISDVKGIAYCVGSIDLKPLRMVSEQDFIKSCSLTILKGFKSIEPTQYAIPLTSEISFFTLSTNPSCKTSAIVNAQPNFSEILLVSLSFLPTKWTEFPVFTNCSAKLEPIDPVAPKIRYFSDIKNFISYI